MKKVLIVSYRFPPDPFIGSLRALGLKKYMQEFGWCPYILTRNLDVDASDTHIVRTPYPEHSSVKNFKKKIGLNPGKTVKKQFNQTNQKNRDTIVDKLLYMAESVVAYPDDQSDWYRYAVDAGSQLLERERFDAIISSSAPVTCHLVARTLSMKFNLPWVADFRDLWTQNHYYKYNSIRHYFEEKLELKTLGNAVALTTVSRSLADTLSLIHDVPAFSVPNGFDPDTVDNVKLPLSPRFSISYTGTLYKGKRDPSLLFEALSQLIKEKKVLPDDIEVNFYGPREDWMAAEIEKYGLEEVVIEHGFIPREDSFRVQRQSHLLLLLLWDNVSEVGVYTGKVFEYLAAKRPIIAIGPSTGSVVQDLIEETNAGIYCSDPEYLKDYILKSYNTYLQQGEVNYEGIEEYIEKYSQREMAKKFASILDSSLHKGE